MDKISEIKNTIINSLNVVDKALEETRSASNWSLLDILGGEFLTSYLKRKKISAINNKLCYLQDQLKFISTNLKNLDQALSFRIPDSFANRFFDIYFDNIFTDINTHQKLSEVENKLVYLRSQLEEILESINTR